MNRLFFISLIFTLAGCVSHDLSNYIPNFTTVPTSNQNKLTTAAQYIDFDERTHRDQLQEFIGVDPLRTEWCAAFVNAVLRESGTPGSESVSEYPLTARSFLNWGERITADDIQGGDLVVFPRGTQGWQGHVGFYLGTVNLNGVEYYQILGGNQSNKVSIELYAASRALGIRRAGANL